MLIVLTDLSRDWGSTQSHLVALGLLLRAEQRLDVRICCPADSPLARAATKHQLPLLALYPPYSDRWWNPLHYVRLRLLTRRHRYCIFHTFSDDAARLALRVQHKRPPERTVIIHNCHNIHSLATRDTQGNMPLWWQELHTILCANNYTRKQLLDAGLDAAHVIRLPAGIDTNALPLRASLPEGRCNILSMTSRADSGCHSVLIKTMAALWQSENLPPWEVRIVGQCDNYQELLDEAHALGVQSRLSLLQSQPLDAVLPCGHIMVSPATSAHGSLPVMAAAWATGLPLLCPSLSTNKEWAKDGKNALLYKAEDPQDLATCLKKLMSDAALYRNLADEGLHSAPLATQETALTHVRELYTQCMHKHGWVLPAQKAAPKADTAAQGADAQAADQEKAQDPEPLANILSTQPEGRGPSPADPQADTRSETQHP